VSDVGLTRDGAVATLTLERPARRNALDPALLEDLASAVGVASEDPDVRVVILAGAGAAFSAGADIEWMRATRELSWDRNRDDAARMAKSFDVLDACPKAVVARVHGAAIGGGAGLVACADVAVAADDAPFAFAEVRLGLLPATIAPYVVRAIGPGRARELFTTGRRFTAGDALDFGLVHHVVEAGGLDERVGAVVDDLMAAGPAAVARNKRLLRDMTAALDLDDLPDRIAEARASDEGQEGATAFLEKRPPAWLRSAGS
jgi:methylglutaconyl-CoA hydratase